MGEVLDPLKAALADRYAIDRELGRGGMATVYLAEDLKHRRKVAVKVLRPDFAPAIGTERFLREIEITANLVHPHILPLLDSGEAEGLLYYVMPYVPGESVRTRLDREGELPIEEGLRIAREVADALAYAHSQRVLHRDIKPDNILLEAGHAIVADFGIARALSVAGSSRLTETGLAIGTPMYMSPEQATGEGEIDARSDVYSLACVLYEMLSGKPPYSGDSVNAIIAQKLQRKPPSLRSIRPDVTHQLDAVLSKALETAPEDRFLTTDDFARSLEAASRGTLATLISPGVSRRRLHRMRRAIIMAGAAAVLGIVVGVAYVATRVLPTSPSQTPTASGVLDPRDRILLSDFENNTNDSLLAFAATELFRTDLSQSTLVRLVEPEYVARALARMEKEADVPLDYDLAHELAIREGLKAFVTGEINSAGLGFVLTVRLVATETGQVLAAQRETASDSTALIEAIDRLSTGLRGRIGEPLRAIRANKELEKVTTPSLRALRRYSEAVRVIRTEGDYPKSVTMLEDAIALDTAFAMAYRLLGLALQNANEKRTLQVEAFTKAFEFRNRLTDRERYLTLGSYHTWVTFRLEEAVSAYRALLETYPSDATALNGLAWLYNVLREYGQAEQAALRAIRVDSSVAVHFANALAAQVGLGRFDHARATLERMRKNLPEHPWVDVYSAQLAAVIGDYDAAEADFLKIRDAYPNFQYRTGSSRGLGALAKVRGKLKDAERHFQDAISAANRRVSAAKYLEASIELAAVDVFLRRSPTNGLRKLEAALERYPLSSLPPIDRPYLSLAELFAAAGETKHARELLNEFERVVNPSLRRRDEPFRHGVWGVVALAEAEPSQSIAELRVWDKGECPACALPYLGRAYELAGEADSALAAYERYVATPWLWEIFGKADHLANAFERAAALYEQRGERRWAAYYYNRLIDLWEDADPELQPRVEAARRAIKALATDA